MNLRRVIKRWLYGSCPGLAGAFPYFGTRVYFPKGSLSFLATCEQGIFEAENVRLLQGLCRPGTCLFDVGAHLGLMAIPVLHHVRNCHVVSFEPSPNALPWLERTIAESPFCGRWTLVPMALGATRKEAEFSLCSPELGLFDGLKPTRRVPETRRVLVQVATLDAEWDRLGRPEVSAIKLDVEGAELEVLLGATECLRANRPSVLLEWNVSNLEAYACRRCAILDFAEKVGYDVFAAPHLIPVRGPKELELQMIRTETFLLAPKPPE